MSNNYRPILLCILDGWGIGRPEDAEHDAIKSASLRFWDFLINNFPHTELITSGEAVGLPEGQMGNSEVGHMTIGSGRVIFQDLLRINQAIKNGELAKHPELRQLIEHHIAHGAAVHLFGLCSNGGVHSHTEHLMFLAKLLAEHKIHVKLHLFLDGRDTAPTSAAIYLNQIDALNSEFIQIATISGRFYAMDRDQRWQRTNLATQAIVNAQGVKIDNWQDYLHSQYEQQIYDEFIVPAIIETYQGFEEGDSVLFTNFRSDRIRQLAQNILKHESILAYKIGMTRYSDDLSDKLINLFPEQVMEHNLGAIISAAHKKQLRIAETEKYAHITFFFNGGREEPYPGEERILIASPSVETYDLQPEMSAYEVTDELVQAIRQQKYDLIVVNYANGDMVGHSGKMEAAIKAVQTLDKCLEILYQEMQKMNGMMIITADHGNVEHMFDTENMIPHTAHSLNPVPLILVANDLFQAKLKLSKGNLSDIAPTILQLLNLPQPTEMTGNSLLKDYYDQQKN